MACDPQVRERKAALLDRAVELRPGGRGPLAASTNQRTDISVSTEPVLVIGFLRPPCSHSRAELGINPAARRPCYSRLSMALRTRALSSLDKLGLRSIADSPAAQHASTVMLVLASDRCRSSRKRCSVGQWAERVARCRTKRSLQAVARAVPDPLPIAHVLVRGEESRVTDRGSVAAR